MRTCNPPVADDVDNSEDGGSRYDVSWSLMPLWYAAEVGTDSVKPNVQASGDWQTLFIRFIDWTIGDGSTVVDFAADGFST